MGPCDSTLELPLSLSKVRPLFLFCSSRGGGIFAMSFSSFPEELGVVSGAPGAGVRCFYTPIRNIFRSFPYIDL